MQSDASTKLPGSFDQYGLGSSSKASSSTAVLSTTSWDLQIKQDSLSQENNERRTEEGALGEESL